MKIAILSRYQGKNQRGVESFVEELCKRLGKKFQVDIFSGKSADDPIKIIRGDYDLVLPMNGRLQSLKVSLGRIFSKYKVIIGGHSGIGRDDIWNILVTRPDVFIALTEAQLKWAKKWGFGIEVIKIPNGVDLTKFNPKGEKMKLGLKDPVILSVGELVWYKYHERAIEAVSRLEKGSLLIVGSGELEDEIRSLGEKRLGERFKIIKAPYDQMPNIYRSVDLFTLPSWDREAFGLVYLEAMASGLPVVAPDDLSRKEIIGEGGILVDVSNIQKYADALDECLIRKWGGKPRAQAEEFSWDKIALKYHNLFEKVANG